MEHKCYRPTPLYDISMYGGDTTPWEFTLVRKNGSNFPIDEGAECIATLTVVPFDAVGGLTGYINDEEIVLQKTAVFSETATGGTAAVFTFTESETKTLHGKFIYQVEVSHGSEKRVGQGNLTILYNVNQEASAE